MKSFYQTVVRLRKGIIVLFLLAAAVCAVLKQYVAVNYDMNDYLPEDAPSTVSLDVMQEEYDGGIPNARVMIRNLSISEALDYKEQLEQVDGVTDVMWLDDSVNITAPLEIYPQETVETYYKNNAALYSVTIEEDSRISAVPKIRSIIGDDNAMTGSAVSTAAATTNTVKEIMRITGIAVLFVLFVLILTMSSWMEPILVLAGLGVAIAINGGTNLIFGEISFVTNAAGSILQLAVSLDYSVFLIHRFEQSREEIPDRNAAMVDALCKSTSSIASSGLTTVIGFLALVLMRFQIGPDLGLALAKGVAISLITVFLFMPSLFLCCYSLVERTRHRPFLPSFTRFGRFVRRISIPMTILFAIVVIPSYFASTSNSYYYGSSHIFGTDTQVGSDAEKINEIFGKNDTYVLLVPNDDIAKQNSLSKDLEDIGHITDIVSYVDTLGPAIPTEVIPSEIRSQLISDHYSRFVLPVNVPYEGEGTFALVEQIRSLAQEYYPDRYYLAGEGVSTYDLMDTVTDDMGKVNLLAIAAVFLVLLLMLRSLSLPTILVLSIEGAIWLNLSVPYLMSKPIFYIAYLIISSVQLGATVDYAILMTDRYIENRLRLNKHDAVVETISNVTVSILTSGSALVVVGFLLGYISSNQLLAQLGVFIGRGAVFSLLIVLFALPGLLYLFDRLVMRGSAAAPAKEPFFPDISHTK